MNSSCFSPGCGNAAAPTIAQFRAVNIYDGQLLNALTGPNLPVYFTFKSPLGNPLQSSSNKLLNWAGDIVG